MSSQPNVYVVRQLDSLGIVRYFGYKNGARYFHDHLSLDWCNSPSYFSTVEGALDMLNRLVLPCDPYVYEVCVVGIAAYPINI